MAVKACLPKIYKIQLCHVTQRMIQIKIYMIFYYYSHVFYEKSNKRCKRRCILTCMPAV